MLGINLRGKCGNREEGELEKANKFQYLWIIYKHIYVYIRLTICIVDYNYYSDA